MFFFDWISKKKIEIKTIKQIINEKKKKQTNESRVYENIHKYRNEISGEKIRGEE